jgi:hypothetical protein
MTLELGISVAEDSTCDGLQFYETTGELSAANLTGWDEAGTDPSIPATSTATAATLTIKNFDGDTLATIDLFTSSFPTTDSTQAYAISASTLGFSGDITSGIYQFSYDVTTSDGSEVPHNKTCYVLLRCAVTCCVNKMYTKVATADCGSCSDKWLARAIEADGYICAAVKALGCDRPSDAQLFIEKANFMCNAENCECS